MTFSFLLSFWILFSSLPLCSAFCSYCWRFFSSNSIQMQHKTFYPLKMTLNICCKKKNRCLSTSFPLVALFRLIFNFSICLSEEYMGLQKSRSPLNETKEAKKKNRQFWSRFILWPRGRRLWKFYFDRIKNECYSLACVRKQTGRSRKLRVLIFPLTGNNSKSPTPTCGIKPAFMTDKKRAKMLFP